ncbi:MAG: acylneuraminate cytidylyltransferase family protein [Candidatus Margulisiibacteriota bacterium]
MSKDKILLTIAARGGSKGVKNKNIRQLCGLPLIAHTILQAKKWGKADRIICSTDSPEIAGVAKEYGAEIPFMRPAELASDSAGKLEVLRHALFTFEQLTDEKYSVLIDLDATAPIRKISDIEGAYQLFLAKRPQSVFSVTKARRNPYFNMVEVGASGQAALVKKLETAIKRRQDAPKIYDMNASIYVYDRDFLLDSNNKSAIADNSLVWIMDELSAFDIDAELDFQYVEYLMNNKVVEL